MASQPVVEEQESLLMLAFCTRDERCQAEADAHEEDCPVEAALRETFGF